MELTLYRYSIPFRKPFRIAGRDYLTRDGLIIHLIRDNSGYWAEASPLPGFSDESLDDTINAIDRVAASIRAGTNLVGACPSLAFATDCLLHASGCNAAKPGILKQYNFANYNTTIPVNAVVGSSSFDDQLETIQQAYRAGFRTFKFKVGVDGDAEFAILCRTRLDYPDIGIRIDANRSWDADTAIRNLMAWKDLGIEFCEEPVQNPTSALLRKITSSGGVPVAADESIRDAGIAEKLIQDRAVDFLILKPSLIGNVDTFSSICRMAASANIGIIVTTLLESGIGRTWVASLAASLGSGRAMGLATGMLLQKDLLPDTHLIRNGSYHYDSTLPANLKPDRAELEKVTESWKL